MRRGEIIVNLITSLGIGIILCGAMIILWDDFSGTEVVYLRYILMALAIAITVGSYFWDCFNIKKNPKGAKTIKGVKVVITILSLLLLPTIFDPPAGYDMLPIFGLYFFVYIPLLIAYILLSIISTVTIQATKNSRQTVQPIQPETTTGAPGVSTESTGMKIGNTVMWGVVIVVIILFFGLGVYTIFDHFFWIK